MKTKLTKNNVELEDLENVDINKLISKKSSKEKAHIAEAICVSVMFQNITDFQREMIFGIMETIPFKKDTCGDGGNIVHVYDGSREDHAHP
eukprot:7618248-Ditylum_brightwellii.AAC.1